MSKDPAFLFYPGDWQGGTMTMNRHLKGCYLDLLLAQFNAGPLSLDQIKNVLGTDFFAAWNELSKKFTQNEAGNFFNERMEFEKSRRKNFSESRRKNIYKRYENTTQKTTYVDTYVGTYVSTTDLHMENENENRNTNEISSFEKSEKLFFDLNEKETENAAEYVSRLTKEKISFLQIQNFFAAFRLNYEKDFHEDRHRVLQHFRNWLKKEIYATPPANGNKPHKNHGSAAGAISLLNRLEHQLNNGRTENH